MLSYVLINNTPCIQTDITLSHAPRGMNLYTIYEDIDSDDYISAYKLRYNERKGSILTPVDLFYNKSNTPYIKLNDKTMIHLGKSYYAPSSPAALSILRGMVNLTNIYNPIITMDLSWALQDDGHARPYTRI